MSFVIEESFVKGKSLTGLCEDGWVATPDYVVVIDGATSKSDYRIDGVTTGRKAMEIISEVTFGNFGIRVCEYYK